MILIMSAIWPTIFSDAKVRSLQSGDHLFRRGAKVSHAYLIREGELGLVRFLADGGALTLSHARAGSLVAEASLFSDRYHCDGICNGVCEVASLPRQLEIERLEANGQTLAALAQAAHEVQNLRTRLEINRHRSLRTRLDAYLEIYGQPETGTWVRVADWIGVTPAALYRELAARRASGAIAKNGEI